MSCEISADFDGNRFDREEWRKARKPHECCECGAEIKPGEKYEYREGLDESFFAYKTCADCASIRKALFCSWTYEEIWEDIAEKYRDGNPPPMALIEKLTPTAKVKLLDFLEKSWEERGAK